MFGIEVARYWDISVSLYQTARRQILGLYHAGVHLFCAECMGLVVCQELNADSYGPQRSPYTAVSES